MAAVAYKHEELQKTPRGYHVRSVTRDKHVVRIAFPPGRRKKGSGKVIEILHPSGERNPRCEISKTARENPGELLIFGNPHGRGVSSAAGGKRPGHQPGCACFACRHARSEKVNRVGTQGSSKLEQQRAARERAERIRAARLNPAPKVVTYQLKTGGGTPIRKATKVIFSDGKEVAFMEKLGKAAAIRQAREQRGMNPGQRRRRSDRNPSETKQAVRLFQGFHGHDPKEIAEKHVSAAVRLDYTALGDLQYLIVETPLGKEATFTFYEDGVKLASSPDGRQFYCIGGDQNILPLLDQASQEKDFIDLGYGIEVEYLARKVHTDFRPVRHYHEFGEETGDLPRMMFDKIRKQIFFIGGNYRVDVNMRAPGTPLGKVSPGIEN